MKNTATRTRFRTSLGMVAILIMLAFCQCGDDFTQPIKIIEIPNQLYYAFLTWSPDGSKLAFWTQDTEYACSLYVWENDGGNITELDLQLYSPPFDTGDTYVPIGLSWTPDGQYLLTTVEMKEPQDTYKFLQISVADNTLAELQLPWGHSGFFPEISPDGQWLAFCSGYYGCGDIWKISYQPGMPLVFDDQPILIGQTYDTARNIHWSPDGSKIVFIPTTLSNTSIYNDSNYDGSSLCSYTIPIPILVLSVDSGEITRITPQDNIEYGCPNWSPDGAWIVYSFYDGTPIPLYKMPAEGGTPQQLTEQPEYADDNYYGDYFPAYAPDGYSLVFVRRTPQESAIFMLENP